MLWHDAGEGEGESLVAADFGHAIGKRHTKEIRKQVTDAFIVRGLASSVYLLVSICTFVLVKQVN